ncbi:putative nadh dehydrogenase protein [Eutypa lata UCREL1]|uniref:Putative nadh dehydrogenase protein n=1 Tax=Eutypa lata (strain UCR-EL1) TaxID=1287681 RepID=M7SCV5_EUTLA|nr:putative nadh dehydrogenase protein [Eutypa lata UCREL1]
MKSPRACRQCRESKRKCVRRILGEPCNACQQRRLKCGAEISTTTQVVGGSESAAATAAAANLISSEGQQPGQPSQNQEEYRNSANLPWGMTVSLVDHYLDEVHDRPHSIFHPATLRTQVRDGSVGGALLCAICAIGSKFSSIPDRRALEARLTTEAKRLLQADLENVCLENVQACILVALLSAGNFASETARRTWWSLYIAGRWCFAGLGLPRRAEEFDGPWDLPMDEITFRSLLPGQETTETSRRPGLWAHMITLVRLFGPIQDLNRRIAKGNSDSAELDQAVEHLGQQLIAWNETLPADSQMTVQNLHNQQQNGLGGPFIALHLSYHHYSTLLYFRFLEDCQAESSAHHTYIARCKRHASSFSDLLRLSRQIKGCGTNYPTIGHMIIVSSSVLLHTLLFADLDRLQEARRELNANFEALVEMQKCWSATSAMVHYRLAPF